MVLLTHKMSLVKAELAGLQWNWETKSKLDITENLIQKIEGGEILQNLNFSCLKSGLVFYDSTFQKGIRFTCILKL